MIEFVGDKATLLAASNKIVSWLFYVQDKGAVNSYYWSTKAVTFDGQPYLFKVTSFSGVTIARPKSEMGLMSPSTLNFTISNKDAAIVADELEGGYVTLTLGMSNSDITDQVMLYWKFFIKKADYAYQSIVIQCEDYFQQYLEGNFPIHIISRAEGSVAWEYYETEDPDPAVQRVSVYWGDDAVWAESGTGFFIMDSLKVRDVFPAVKGDITDDCCIPLPFGECYIPVRSAYIIDDRFYVLGPAGFTYNIIKARSPRNYLTVEGGVVYDPLVDPNYSFVQDTKVSEVIFGNNFRVVQPMIAGTTPPYTNGVFPDGDHYFDLPMKFTRSDTVDITNPADVIYWILISMGITATDIDYGVGSTFATAADVYNDWGLTINGAFWKVITREAALTSLLNMCNSVLLFTDKVYLKVMSPVAQMTIEADDILKTNETGVGTFSSSKLEKTLYDSGNVEYAPPDDCVDLAVSALVPTGESSTNIDSAPFQMMFTSDGSVAQGLARLFFQRKLWKKATEKLRVKSSCLGLQPTDFISIVGKNYGGLSPNWAHDAMIDSMTINKDVSIELTCTTFTNTLDSNFTGSHSRSPSASPSVSPSEGGENLLPFFETFEDVTDYDNSWLDVVGYESYTPNPNTPVPQEVTGWGSQCLKANLYAASQGSGGIDIYNGKLYAVDHMGCAIKVYDANTGVLLNRVSTGPLNQGVWPSDVRVVDGQAYVSFTYLGAIMRTTLTSDGLNFIPGTVVFKSVGEYSAVCGLSVTPNLVYAAVFGGVTILNRDLQNVGGWSFNPDSTTRIPLGIHCVDDANVLVTANRTNWAGYGDASYDYSGVYRWNGYSYDIKYGTSGTGATEVDTATGVWYYEGKVFITDGILGYYPMKYSPATIPKVLVFDYATGALLYTFGVKGEGTGQFIGPTGICVYNNIIYINDLFRGVVLRFSISGTYLGHM